MILDHRNNFKFDHFKDEIKLNIYFIIRKIVYVIGFLVVILRDTLIFNEYGKVCMYVLILILYWKTV